MERKTERKVEIAQLCSTLCNPMDCVAHQASLSMGFSRQEYWSGLPFSFPQDLPNPGIKPESPALQADFLPFEPSGKPSPVQIWSQNNGLAFHASMAQ